MDVIDYVVGYNSVWFRFQGFPVSMNTVSVCIFGVAIIREWIRTV